jgi:hypothetical protein
MLREDLGWAPGLDWLVASLSGKRMWRFAFCGRMPQGRAHCEKGRSALPVR